MGKKTGHNEGNEISKRQITRNNRRRYFVALLTLAIFIIIGFSMFNVVSLKIQEAEAIALNQRLLQEKERLQGELAVVNDPIYIEQQARIKLKMIRPGEVLYVFPDNLITESAIQEKND